MQQCLAWGCDALGLDISAAQQQKLLDYLDLLQKWNRAYNLTAIRDPLAMVTRHLLDSLAVVPHLSGNDCLDIGTGAGLPGIPLAIALPGRQFHLLDSNGKKTRFLFQVKMELGLANITVCQARVETLATSRQYDVIVSRAFASLAAMVAGTRHLLAPGGCFLAMKGAWPQDELAAIEDQCVVLGVESLTVPGLDEQRHLVRLALRPS
ncbi:16S rRNA (guanine(527)-N(7))-methyltransferase RsmG [Kineobactrum salinum]|uniref:Ribosomal RNA small subunit methyltransferase G n=1 Tax=Kineobactrum salinum TaxID=2708301 RepID=A0A6C0UBX5_9GAMM|nr:16S rRNA (guanine(527)-N(7))-methyltransferase RsmG [Kineobactrum salinum]